MQFLSTLLSLTVWMHFATAFIPSLHSKISLSDDHSHSYKNLTTMRKMGLFDGIMNAFENEEVCVDAFQRTFFLAFGFGLSRFPLYF